MSDTQQNPSPSQEEENPMLNRKTGATDLFLIRHGDALPGPEMVLPGGKYDDQPLSELGRAQAEAIPAEWASTEFAAIYSSPLRRTIETATPLAKALGLEILIEENLREVRLGAVVPEMQIPNNADAETTAKALRARLDYIAATISRTGYWSAIPGSEPSDQFRQRVVTIVDEIAARHPGERVAIFSHGGAINVYFAEVLGIARDFFYPIPNTSVNVVRVAGNRRYLLALNDVAHLRAANLITDI